MMKRRMNKMPNETTSTNSLTGCCSKPKFYILISIGKRGYNFLWRLMKEKRGGRGLKKSWLDRLQKNPALETLPIWRRNYSDGHRWGLGGAVETMEPRVKGSTVLRALWGRASQTKTASQRQECQKNPKYPPRFYYWLDSANPWSKHNKKDTNFLNWMLETNQLHYPPFQLRARNMWIIFSIF